MDADNRQLQSQSSDINPPYALQLLALGMVIASRDLRPLIDVSMFSDPQMRAAVESVKREVAGQSFTSLSKVLEHCGVDWTGTGDGDPKDAVVEKLKVDSRYSYYVERLRDVAGLLSPTNPTDKCKVIDKINDLDGDYQWWCDQTDKKGGSNDQSV